jgi:prenylcysteine oxidase/farnesylcysteine lyase
VRRALCTARSFTVTTVRDDTGAETVHSGYNAVVIAAPLEAANISIDGVTAPRRREFVQTHVTFLVGVVNPLFFGLSAGDYDVDDVLTLSGVHSFRCLVAQEAAAYDDSGAPVPRVYKLFSTQSLVGSDVLASMFERYDVDSVKTWVWDAAYPRFNAPEELAPFEVR